MSNIPGKCDDGAFRAQVIADSSGVWAGNALRFDTAENAEAYAWDLMGRWTAVREWRVVEDVLDRDTNAWFEREVKRSG